MNKWRFMQPQCQMVENIKNMKKTAAKVKKTMEKRDKTEIERGDKYGPRTLPKPRGWMH